MQTEIALTNYFCHAIIQGEFSTSSCWFFSRLCLNCGWKCHFVDKTTVASVPLWFLETLPGLIYPVNPKLSYFILFTESQSSPAARKLQPVQQSLCTNPVFDSEDRQE